MKAKQQIEDKDWELLAQTIYDEKPSLNSEENLPFVNEIISNEIEREQILKLSKQVDLYFNLKKYPAENALEIVESKIQAQHKDNKSKIRKMFTNPVYRMVAAILVAAILLVSGYEIIFNPSQSTAMLEISTTDNVFSTYTLPDGTLVSLNRNTKVIYPKKFNGNIREVSIEGEAFFEVKPNKNKPFIIHAGKAQIKVLGTSFNVNAYPEAKLVEVIVETGKVQVLNQTNEKIQSDELILIPGDKGTLVLSSNSLLKTTNQNPNFLAWKTHNLIFKATSLSEVIDDLQKVYKVNIHLADSKLNGLLLTAQFNNYSLDFILKVLESTFQIDVENMNGQYILKARS